MLAGESRSYADEVEGCYGVRPVYTDEADFAAAHERLDELLPGDGTLAERYERWQSSSLVPAGQVERLIAAVIEEARVWTRGLVELPDGEGVAVEIVHDEPWLAFCNYLGNLRSRVAVNVDLPLSAIELLTLAIHETYPGHHAERVSKEHLLVRGQGCSRRRWCSCPRRSRSSPKGSPCSRRSCCSGATEGRHSPRSCTMPASSSTLPTHSPSCGLTSRAGGPRSTRR